jgi:hypothetical protein
MSTISKTISSDVKTTGQDGERIAGLIRDIVKQESNIV